MGLKENRKQRVRDKEVRTEPGVELKKEIKTTQPKELSIVGRAKGADREFRMLNLIPRDTHKPHN